MRVACGALYAVALSAVALGIMPVRGRGSFPRGPYVEVSASGPIERYRAVGRRQDSDDAIKFLQAIGAAVTPILRKHNWRLFMVTEFMSTKVLGMNENRRKVYLRLRSFGNPDEFLSFKEVLETMLHELAHNISYAHDKRFYDALRDLEQEMQVLERDGYLPGSGFALPGQRLGGSASGSSILLRRPARCGGVVLGGTPPSRDKPLRELASAAALARMRNACGTGHDGCERDKGPATVASSDQSSAPVIVLDHSDPEEPPAPHDKYTQMCGTRDNPIVFEDE